jgi:hypothetical protein
MNDGSDLTRQASKATRRFSRFPRFRISVVVVVSSLAAPQHAPAANVATAHRHGAVGVGFGVVRQSSAGPHASAGAHSRTAPGHPAPGHDAAGRRPLNPWTGASTPLTYPAPVAPLQELARLLLAKVRGFNRRELAESNPHLSGAQLDLLLGQGQWPAGRPVMCPLDSGPIGQRPLVGVSGVSMIAARVAAMVHACEVWTRQQGGDAPEAIRLAWAMQDASHRMGGFEGSGHQPWQHGVGVAPRQQRAHPTKLPVR